MKLPTKFTFTEDDIPEDIYEELAEYMGDKITEKVGFCHNGFACKIKINISDVMWDIDED